MSSPEVRSEWARLLRTWEPESLPQDPAEFITATLGYEFTDFQRRWWEFFASHPMSLLLAPRGHGKSTILTVAFSLFRALHDPELRVIICSNTAAQAQALLREVRAHLESNQNIVRVAGALAGRPWSESELALARRSRRSKEATLTAMGVMGPVISRHYDLALLDDVVDEDAARTKRMRDRMAAWYYKELLPTLEPEGELHVLGTRYHRDDLYGRLMAAGMPFLVERAVIGEGDSERALWESKFPLALLREKRAEAGPAIFNTQYQNDVTAMSGRIFRPEWIESRVSPLAARRYQGVDLAIGTGDHHDYFALVTVGELRPGSFHVLGAYQARLSFEDQFQAVRGLYVQYNRPDSPVAGIGVEANAYQEALAQRLRDEGLPVKSLFQTRDKVTRALRLQGMLQTGRITFEPGRAEIINLIEQLLAFPDGGHDDLVDALELAARTAAEARNYSELPGFSPDIRPEQN